MTMPTPPGETPTQPASQPTYVDPITGAPLYVDPSTGQLTYGVSAPQTSANVPGFEEPGAPPTVSLTPDQQAGGLRSAGFPMPGQTLNYPAAGQPAYSPYAYPAAGGPGYAYAISASPYAARRTNGLAVASLVAGISALPLVSCYGVGALVGIVGAILGHVARRQVRERGEEGAGMALAGIICGWTALALGLGIVGLIVFLFTQMPDIPVQN